MRLTASRVAALCAMTLLLAVALPANAYATQPKAGCWGTCGGPAGPLDGVLTVIGDKVTNFEYSESCLGSTKYGTDYLHILARLAIGKTGTFAYDGSAIVSDLSSPKRLYSISVTLSGSFKSATSATLKVTTASSSCSSKQLSMRFVG